jgi:tripartite-type tricarboxylate transporter receptor subunit TctC
MYMKKIFRQFGCFFLILTFLPAFAYAQDYPTRPIKIVIPYAPGGASSVIWRGIADPMSKVLGQPVLIENKPGGGTSLAWTYVAGAKPDGYTVGGAPVSTLTNTYLTYKVSYHPVNSFVHIGGIWQYNQAFVVGTNSPLKSWKEFFDYVKEHPNELKVGYSNPTALAPITIKWIGKSKGLVWKEVHFTSEAECITALLGKHIDAFVGSGVVHTLLADGRARALLAITRGRMPGYPDVPTVKELYGKDCFNSAGLIAPAGVPEPIVSKLEKALQEGVKSPEYLKVLEKMGAFALYRNHGEFKKDVQATMEEQKDILKAIGMLRKELE